MAEKPPENTKDAIIRAGTELMRRDGYVATTVDQICAAAGVTKGAFFHHFPSKEALAENCLENWQRQMEAFHRSAGYQAIDDPVEKVFAAVDYMSDAFSRPGGQKSCLAGTTVQEVSESNPTLRAAANECLVQGEHYFQSLLDAACDSRGVALDTASLAEHWMATVQGALLQWKASRDPQGIARNFAHLKAYLATLFNQKH
jgi:TetR/AcrR family transcriptional repressor of nem operon